jgi:hypothetical protein
MISIKLCGGLGNQLFQIFTTISYSIDNNIDFCFIGFSPGANKTRNTYWDSFLVKLKKHSLNKSITNINKYKEKNFSYNKIPIRKDIFIKGYFQSYKYFNHNSKKIINLIGINKFQKKTNKNSISMHFRMGDYKNKNFHNILNINYYIEALKYIINKTNKDDWVVHYACEEEDINDVKEKISILKKTYKNLNFIRIDNNLSDWEQMIEMSCCNHNIIANSSFSWWSAYLNNNDNKIIVCPKNWFGMDTRDLVFKNWIRIN